FLAIDRKANTDRAPNQRSEQKIGYIVGVAHKLIRSYSNWPIRKASKLISPKVIEGNRNHPSLPPFMRVQRDGVFLSIKLQRRASANGIGEALGSELRIKVTAPPVDSAANEALIRLLAERLECSRNQLELVRGQTNGSMLHWRPNPREAR